MPFLAIFEPFPSYLQNTAFSVVKSRHALGSPGWPFGCSFVTIPFVTLLKTISTRLGRAWKKADVENSEIQKKWLFLILIIPTMPALHSKKKISFKIVVCSSCYLLDHRSLGQWASKGSTIRLETKKWRSPGMGCVSFLINVYRLID